MIMSKSVPMETASCLQLPRMARALEFDSNSGQERFVFEKVLSSLGDKDRI